MMSAIETIYKGYRFRSRLEARWAVFFDVMGIEWLYEPEGFRWHRYTTEHPPDFWLPDFYLPKTKTWVEVKGDVEEFAKKSQQWFEAHDYGDSPLPGFHNNSDQLNGILLLTSIHDYAIGHVPFHQMALHHKGVYAFPVIFTPKGLTHLICYYGDVGFEYTENCLCHEFRIRNRYLDEYGNSLCRFAYECAKQARFEHGQKGIIMEDY